MHQIVSFLLFSVADLIYLLFAVAECNSKLINQQPFWSCHLWNGVDATPLD